MKTITLLFASCLLAWALPTTIEPCSSSALLSSLIADYGAGTDTGCSIGGSALWGFTFQEVTSPPEPRTVSIQPSDLTFNILLNSTIHMPRIEISGPLTLSNQDAVIHFILSFNVSALSPSQPLYEVALGAEIASSQNGNEARALEDIDVLDGALLAQMQITQGQQSQIRTFPLTSEITITKEFLVKSKIGGSASLGTVAQDLTQVPEPAALMLAGIGLLAVAKARVRRERAAGRSRG